MNRKSISEGQVRKLARQRGYSVHRRWHEDLGSFTYWLHDPCFPTSVLNDVTLLDIMDFISRQPSEDDDARRTALKACENKAEAYKASRPPSERLVRRRASNRGFHIVCISSWSREGKRREALGIGPCLLIDDQEKVHLSAATMQQINDYLEAFPERPSLLHDRQRERLKASGLGELEAMLVGGNRPSKKRSEEIPDDDDDDDGPELV
jgi:hypothetical protein